MQNLIQNCSNVWNSALMSAKQFKQGYLVNDVDPYEVKIECLERFSEWHDSGDCHCGLESKEQNVVWFNSDKTIVYKETLTDIPTEFVEEFMTVYTLTLTKKLGEEISWGKEGTEECFSCIPKYKRDTFSYEMKSTRSQFSYKGNVESLDFQGARYLVMKVVNEQAKKHKEHYKVEIINLDTGYVETHFSINYLD